MTNPEINAANIIGNAALADIAWSNTHSKTIENWLENHYNGSGNLFKSSLALIICIFITVKIII